MADPLSVPCHTCGAKAGVCCLEGIDAWNREPHISRVVAANDAATGMSARSRVLAEVEAMLVEERDAGASIGRALVRVEAAEDDLLAALARPSPHPEGDVRTALYRRAWEEDRPQCESCDEPAFRSDPEGVPLCDLHSKEKP